MKFLGVSILLALAFALLPVLAAEEAQAGDSIKMGTVTCPNVTFDCRTLSENKKEIISASNQCIAKLFGISEPIMGAYNTRGEFENCATSSRRAVLGNGKEVWASCCLKKTRGAQGVCALRCTRYLVATN